MDSDNKPVVFISHISEEAAIALELKDQLLSIFGNRISVFCSSDKESIQGGQEWFGKINASLARADVLIALLSGTSRTRPWILYEIGFAKGNGRKILPLTIRNLETGRLTYPLAGFQVWSIHHLSGIVEQIAQVSSASTAMPPLGSYRDAILKAENKVTIKQIKVEPVIVRPQNPNGSYLLMMHLTNLGNTDIDLLHLELYIPEALLPLNTNLGHFNNQVVWDHFHIRGTAYKRVRYHVHPGDAVEALVSTITPSMGEVRPAYPRISLGPNFDATGEASEWLLYYQVHARNHVTERERLRLSDLRVVSEFNWDERFE